ERFVRHPWLNNHDRHRPHPGGGARRVVTAPSRRRVPCRVAPTSGVRCVWFAQDRVQRRIDRGRHQVRSTTYRLPRGTAYRTTAIDPPALRRAAPDSCESLLPFDTESAHPILPGTPFEWLARTRSLRVVPVPRITEQSIAFVHR